MKNFVLKLTGLGLVMVALFFTSCGEDPIVVDPLGPEISFVADPGFLNADSEVILGEGFSVKIRMSKGDAQLGNLLVEEGSSKLATSRFTIDGGAVTTQNALVLFGTDKDGVTYSIDITPSGTEAVGDFTTYTFTVTDDSGETDAVDIVIETTEEPGTPLSQTLTGVLLNQAGPAGTGGLKLADGTGTGSADAIAEIRDLGIDCTVVLPAENWRAQFGTVNGGNMVKVDVSQLDNFSFDDVTKKEVISDIYTSNGIALSDGVSQSPTCVETAVTDVSGTVAVDDLFVVFANNNYYLIRVDEINYVGSSNGDNFVFSIKY